MKSGFTISKALIQWDNQLSFFIILCVNIKREGIDAYGSK